MWTASHGSDKSQGTIRMSQWQLPVRHQVDMLADNNGRVRCQVAGSPPVKPRIGRPPAQEPRDRRITVRLTEREYEVVLAAADRFDQTVSEWTRDRLVAAAKRAVRP